MVKSIVALSARTYLPFMQANLEALQKGAENVRLELLGETYEQAPFRYQGKTYTRLKSFEQLTGAAREQVDAVFDAADAKAYFTSPERVGAPGQRTTASRYSRTLPCDPAFRCGRRRSH